jgi:hypothetical protein
VVEGGAAWTGRVPRPVVVVGEEVLDGAHFKAVGSTDRGLETVPTLESGGARGTPTPLTCGGVGDRGCRSQSGRLS